MLSRLPAYQVTRLMFLQEAMSLGQASAPAPIAMKPPAFESYPLLPPELSSIILSFLLPPAGAIGDPTPSTIKDLVVSFACLRLACMSFNQTAVSMLQAPDAWHRVLFLERASTTTRPAVRGRLLVESLPALCQAPSSLLLHIAMLLVEVLEKPQLEDGVLPAMANVSAFVFRVLDDDAEPELGLAAMRVCHAAIRARRAGQVVFSTLVEPLMPRFRAWLRCADGDRERFHMSSEDSCCLAAAPELRLLPVGSMRKAAGDLLSAIAEHWPVATMVLLPELESCLEDTEGGAARVWDREAALLMLGLIAVPSGHQLQPGSGHLLTQLRRLASEDAEPMVRCTAFWALGCVLQGLYIHDASLLPPAVLEEESAVFLHGMRHDPHHYARSSAANALADLLQSLRPSTVAGLFDTLADECFDCMLACPHLPGPYDVLAELVQHRQPAELVPLVLPRLLSVWRGMERTAISQSYAAEAVLAVLSCLTAGDLAEEMHVRPLLDLCRETVAANLPLTTLKQERILDAVLGVVVSCEDVLSDGRLLHTAPWLEPHLLPIVTAVHHEPNLSVSAYALLGEAMRMRPEPFIDCLPEWMPLASASLDRPWETPTKANNAAWTCGVAAIYAREGALAAYAAQLVDRLLAIIMRQDQPPVTRLPHQGPWPPSRGRAPSEDELYLQFTAACTLGALAVNCTADVSARLAERVGDDLPLLWARWADVLVRGHEELREDMHSEEQVHAVLGFVLVMSQQEVTDLLRGPPGGGNSLLQQYLLAVSTIIDDGAWVEGEERIREVCERTIVVCRDTLERLRSYVRGKGSGSLPSWATLVEGLDRALVMHLRAKLGI